VISNCNGASSYDLFSPENEFLQPPEKLPEIFWEAIHDSKISNILRESTSLVRLDFLFKNKHHFIENSPIADFTLVSAMGTRVNLALDYKVIVANKNLQNQWHKLTSVRVVDRQSMLSAFEILSQDWGIYFTGSATLPTIDVTSSKVNKAVCVERVNEYIKLTYARYGMPIEHFESIQVGDTPFTETFNGNDGPMLNMRGGICVADSNLPYIRTEDGWPLVYTDGSDRTKRTNNLLKLILENIARR